MESDCDSSFPHLNYGEYLVIHYYELILETTPYKVLISSRSHSFIRETASGSCEPQVCACGTPRLQLELCFQKELGTARLPSLGNWKWDLELLLQVV